VPCDYAIPCATQNEIDEDEAKLLIENGCKGISEGANMPTVVAGINAFLEAGILYGPSKAANAGGVAVSGMEMSQNSARISWSEDELQKLLLSTMEGIHESCFRYGEGKGVNGGCDYLMGANVAGFVKIADAMLAYGVL
jgi:glutamate dehydrogenase (NADP+)